MEPEYVRLIGLGAGVALFIMISGLLAVMFWMDQQDYKRQRWRDSKMAGPNGDGLGGDVVAMALAREAKARREQEDRALEAKIEKDAQMAMLERATHEPVLPITIDAAMDDVRKMVMTIRGNFAAEQPSVQHPIGAMEIDLTRLKFLAVTAGAPPIGNLRSLAANAVYALAAYYTMRDAYREMMGDGPTDKHTDEAPESGIGGADGAGSGDSASVGVRSTPDIHPASDGPVDEVSG